MRKIRFGNNGDFGEQVARRLDGERFTADYKFDDDVDFDAYHALVPFHLDDYGTLDRRKDLLGTKYWRPSPKLVDLCNDKLVLNELLLGSPFAELVPPLMEGHEQRFPYILKRRRDENAFNSHVIRGPDDEAALAEKRSSPQYFRQAYIPGDEEFTLHALIAHDRIHYVQSVHYAMPGQFCAKGNGSPADRWTFLSENPHLNVFKPLLAYLDYAGTCCIDYKLEEGRPKLLEINPRPGFSLCWDINRYLDAYLSSLGVV